jgi:hypothetical protein
VAVRRPFLLPAFVAIAGCAHSPVNAPSLSPRPAEAIDPRIPVPEPVLSATPNAALVEQLNGLVAQTEAGDSQFQPAASAAERAAAAAGASQSESWIAAQQALSVAVAARAPVTRAAADVDALGAQRIQKLGGIAAADLKAIDAASARIRAIDDREAATIKSLQDRLAR